MNDARIALSTAGSIEEAHRIARTLVEQQLAACVNIIPQLTSIYRWQGKIEEASEVLMLIKTSAARLDQMKATLRLLHSYETPEFLVLDVASGNRAYLDWLFASVAAPATPPEPD